MAGFTNFVTVASSLVALLVAFANAVVVLVDREVKAHQLAFDDQAAMTRIFFERIAGHYCESKSDAILLVAITSLMAKGQQSRLPEPLRGPDIDGSMVGLADLIGDDLKRRSCPGDATVAILPQEATGEVMAAARETGTTYEVKEQVAQSRPTGAGPSIFTIYVQYSLAEERARRLQHDLQTDRNLRAPGIERVPAVPSRDEIRLYKDAEADRRVAEELRAHHGLEGARIVSLAGAYPKLAGRTLEVWLADP